MNPVAEPRRPGKNLKAGPNLPPSQQEEAVEETEPANAPHMGWNPHWTLHRK